jgi:hypothetical protein
MYNARRIARLAGAEENENFRQGNDWFNSVVSSAQQEKKFTGVTLGQARAATDYFEMARAEALQHLMQ